MSEIDEQTAGRDNGVLLTVPEVFGLASALWDLGAVLKSEGDPECYAAEVHHEASFLEEEAGVPPWPTSSVTIAEHLETIDEILTALPAGEQRPPPGHVASELLATDVADICQVLWKLGVLLRESRAKQRAWLWAHWLEWRLPRSSWSMSDRQLVSADTVRSAIQAERQALAGKSAEREPDQEMGGSP